MKNQNQEIGSSLVIERLRADQAFLLKTLKFTLEIVRLQRGKEWLALALTLAEAIAIAEVEDN